MVLLCRNTSGNLQEQVNFGIHEQGRGLRLDGLALLVELGGVKAASHERYTEALKIEQLILSDDG